MLKYNNQNTDTYPCEERMNNDKYGTLDTLNVNDEKLKFYSLKLLEKKGFGHLNLMPISIKI